MSSGRAFADPSCISLEYFSHKFSGKVTVIPISQMSYGNNNTYLPQTIIPESHQFIHIKDIIVRHVLYLLSAQTMSAVINMQKYQQLY